MDKFNLEIEFVDKVERCLKDHGYKTFREVIPDQCAGWEKPYRVDLIFYHKDYGYIGVEAKNTDTLRSGGVISDAIDQIDKKYRDKTFFNGNMIEKWAIMLPSRTGWEHHENAREIEIEVMSFIKNFLSKRYNIYILEYFAGIDYASGNKSPEVCLYKNATKNLFRIGGEWTPKIYLNGKWILNNPIKLF